MKRSLSILLIACLLAALLTGCAGKQPTAQEEPPAPEDSSEPDDVVVVADEPADTPAALEISFSLPAAESDGDALSCYFSGAEAFDCAFAYPSYCTVWVENGAIRLNPGWFFARIFLTGVLRDSENAPDELIDLLAVEKWNTFPEEGTVGTGWRALNADHLKYDTYRRWVAWETDERYYLFYGVCYDHWYSEQQALITICRLIAESFRTGDELLSAAPESGTLLRQSGEVELLFEGVGLGGGDSPRAELRLRAANRSGGGCTLTVDAYTADGRTFPLGETLGVAAGEEQLWTLSLPLQPEEGGALFESIGFIVYAQGDGGETLFELTVRIELTR